jgi:hypothetical protein
MPKNIIIFSDGTGQGGGLTPDPCSAGSSRHRRWPAIGASEGDTELRKGDPDPRSLGGGVEQIGASLPPAPWYRRALNGGVGGLWRPAFQS